MYYFQIIIYKISYEILNRYVLRWLWNWSCDKRGLLGKSGCGIRKEGGSEFQSWGTACWKARCDKERWVLLVGLTRVTSLDERVRPGFCMDMSSVRYTGSEVVIILYVRAIILYVILSLILSQWRDFSIGVIWQNLDRQYTARANEFWINCILWISHWGKLNNKELQ